MKIREVKVNLDNDLILAFFIIFVTIFVITIPVTYQVINQANQHRIAIKNAEESSIRKAGEEIEAKVTPEGKITFKISTGERIIIIKEDNNLLMVQNLKGRIGYINTNNKLELDL